MKYILKEYPDLKERVSSMTVEDLLYTVAVPEVNPAGEDLPRSTAAVFMHPAPLEQAVTGAKRINEDRESPALIVSDMEFGAGGAIHGAVDFPSMMAAAETGDPSLAYKMGAVAAAEAIEAGYHWTFGPCVDILLNHESPIVSIRTAADNADGVITYCGAYMRGLQDNGLIATLKHFPGDGCSDHDQHLAPTVNPLSKEEWMNSFGKVYKTLIEDGAMAVMPGHISLPAFDSPDENGIYPPASVSKALLTDLLRGELGFGGIVCSDAVNMGGFCGYKNLYEASAMFLAAGGDGLLFMKCTDEYIEEMKKHIAGGLLSLEVLRDRAYRMLCFGRHYFEMRKSKELPSFDRAYAEGVSREMVEKCVRTVRDRAGLLPYDVKGKRLLHVSLVNAGMRDTSVITEVTKLLSDRGADVREVSDPGPDALRLMAKSGDYDLIVCSVMAGASWGLDTAKLCGPVVRNMMCGWMRYGTPVLFVCYKNPYFSEQYEATADTVINTYGFTAHTAKVVVDIITGK